MALNNSTFNDMLKTLFRLSCSKQLLPCVGVLLSLSLAIELVPVQARLISLGSTQTQLGQTKQARGQVPGRRRGGARRGDCPAASTELTALVPATEVVTQTLPETYVGGSTTAAHPTFWFYVPYALTADLTAEFILQDDAGEDVYRIPSANFPTSERTPGIIGISLPSTVAPLKIGKVYQWYFKLTCKMEAPTYVQGGIERIPPDSDLAGQLANVSPQEQVRLYLANDLWYDAVNVLAQLRRTRPTDAAINAAWVDLLRSVKLEDISSER
jgi:Domain of Unknown Function (DUF928)